MNIAEDLDWETFLVDCGKQVNESIAIHNYQKKYYKKNISWEGYIMRIDELDADFGYQSQVLLQTDVRDKHTEYRDYGNREPDLILFFEPWTFNIYENSLAGLRKGDKVKFNATVVALGQRSDKLIYSKY